MKKNKTIVSSFAICCTIIFFCLSCKQDKYSKSTHIIPQAFPSEAITGIKFPTDSTSIYEWLSKQDTSSIAKHAWGIWAGLTAPTNQTIGGDKLLVFETWTGTNELQIMMKNGGSKIPKTSRTLLTRPSQFHHAVIDNQAVDSTDRQWVTVNYSPDAAEYALKKDIFNIKNLTPYLKTNKGSGAIPEFPSSSITVKPTYLYVKNNGKKLIAIPVWPGMPAVAQAFPDFTKYWKYVFVDPTNKRGVKTPIPVDFSAEKDPTKISNATVNIEDFIHFKVDAVMADYLNKEQGQGTAQKGDLALLMGMHVASKEIANWTWQTYFWAPDPVNPPSPSSKFNYDQLIKSKIKLGKAAAHYAVLPAYSMVWPNQPINNGTNENTKAVFGFNPYLEASFGPSTFPAESVLKQKMPNAKGFRYGMQTNCMSCHAMATVNGVYNSKNKSYNALPYITDQYISMNDTLFNRWVKLDFAWSIQAMAYPDSLRKAKSKKY